MRVLLTGATGFFGTALRLALLETSGIRTSMLTRRAIGPEGDYEEWVFGDIRDEPAMRAATRGVDVVIHSASYIGYDQEAAHEVNVSGTATLVRAARAAGVSRFYYMSTAAVYGPGPHQQLRPRVVETPPLSALSASRWKAEQVVLNFGGCVIRPHLVYGVGDRWVVPTLIKTATSNEHPSFTCTALHSVIDVAQLAALVVALVNQPGDRAEIFHAASPVPIGLASILDRLRLASLLASAASSKGPITQPQGRSEVPRQGAVASLLESDHVFDSSSIWARAHLSAAPEFTLGDEAIAWYRSFLRTPRVN